MNFNRPIDAERSTETDRAHVAPRRRARRGGRLAGFGLILVAGTALAFGACVRRRISTF